MKNLMEEERLIQLFEQAIKDKSSDEVEEVITLCFSKSDIKNFEKYLIELIDLDWHFCHEDIALLLQKFGSTNSVEKLFRSTTMKFGYLDYNDSKVFARKCTWALADIGNNEAKNALAKLSQNQDREIAEYAKERIDNWSKEQNRKRHSS